MQKSLMQTAFAKFHTKVITCVRGKGGGSVLYIFVKHKTIVLI